MSTNTSTNITNNTSSDEFPMWAGDKIYYLSDSGPNSRYNIWVYDMNSGTNTQIIDDFVWTQRREMGVVLRIV
ncbi:MAG: hypothetical protein RLN82_02115, partial [Pseudomonadales bacterium]